MLGSQLMNFVPLEPGGDPIPKLPRPTGLFDHLSFANASPVDVSDVHYVLTGVSTAQNHIAPVHAHSVGWQTDNFNQGQLQYVHLVITMANGTVFTLPTFRIHDVGTWYLGRITAGVTATPDGATLVPYCVLTLFPDDPMSNGIFVQVVPHDRWI